MLKNVAGGRIDPRSEPGEKSLEASAMSAKSPANDGEVMQAPPERIMPEISASQASLRTFKRGVIVTSPLRNVRQRLCVDRRPELLSDED